MGCINNYYSDFNVKCWTCIGTHYQYQCKDLNGRGGRILGSREGNGGGVCGGGFNGRGDLGGRGVSQGRGGRGGGRSGRVGRLNSRGRVGCLEFIAHQTQAKIQVVYTVGRFYHCEYLYGTKHTPQGITHQEMQRGQ